MQKLVHSIQENKNRNNYRYVLLFGEDRRETRVGQFKPILNLVYIELIKSNGTTLRINRGDICPWGDILTISMQFDRNLLGPHPFVCDGMCN